MSSVNENWESESEEMCIDKTLVNWLDSHGYFSTIVSCFHNFLLFVQLYV